MELPTFEVGQRVRVHNRPVEWSCPKCRYKLFSRFPYQDYYTGSILRQAFLLHCPQCSHDLNPDGWWGINYDLGDISAAPYTLIEAIKEEAE